MKSRQILVTEVAFLISLLVVFLFFALSCKVQAQSTAQFEVRADGMDEWPMFHHDSRQSGYSKSSVPTTNTTLWSINLNETFTLDTRFMSPAIVNNIVYIVANGYATPSVSKVYAINATTGAVLWKYDLPWWSAAPAISNGILVLALHNGELHMLNATHLPLQNRLIRSVKLSNDPLFSPTIENNVIYTATRKTLYAINLNNGIKMWEKSTFQYEYISGSTSIANGITYIPISYSDGSTYHGIVRAFNATTGGMLWSAFVSDSFALNVVVAYGMLFVSGDIVVHAFDARTGVLKWTAPVREPFPSVAVLPSLGRIYAVQCANISRSGLLPGLFAIDRDTGSILWRYTSFPAHSLNSPVVADDKVFFGDSSGIFYALNANTGSLLWSFKAGKGYVSQAAIAYGRIYIYTQDGMVHAIGALSPPIRTPVHDVGVKMDPLFRNRKSVVCQGYSMRIPVIIDNQGDISEGPINVTVYANDTVIGTQTLYLPFFELKTITFKWNTTSYTKGRYVLKVQVSVVPNESDTSDNIFVYGTVQVSYPGDITGRNGLPDGIVDIRDIALISYNYGKNVPPAPPNCDINDDDVVDIIDLAIASKNYGKTDP